jgi:hypothetical protein
MNWQDYQALTANAFQQVDPRISKFILKCGFSWSPAMAPSQPILLTQLGNDREVKIESLIQLGFKLEEDKVTDPSMENGFDYSGYITRAWESLGLKNK